MNGVHLNEDSTLGPPTPADVVMYMINEATRRTDINPQGEFGMAGKQVWFHKNLLKRIDEYIERLVTPI